MQQLCFFLQNAVICGMFSSWNQIMPFLLAHLNSPPLLQFLSIGQPTKNHHPHKKKQLQCRWPATLPGCVWPAAKKPIKVAAAPNEGGSNDPPQIRTTPVFPKVPLEAKGSQGSQWSNPKTSAMGEKVHNFFLYQFGWRFKKIQHWVWNRYRAQFLNEDLSFKWSKINHTKT